MIFQVRVQPCAGEFQSASRACATVFNDMFEVALATVFASMAVAATRQVNVAT